MAEPKSVYFTTESPSLKKVSDWIMDGLVVLPKFQRPFVWRKPAIIALLDSIRDNHPIGSILLWESEDQALSSSRQIGDVDVQPPKSGNKVKYVLDGQQRLSSICGPLNWV